MKYILLNDLNYIVTKKYKMIIAYILVFTLYFYITKQLITSDMIPYFLNNVFGFKINIFKNISDIFSTMLVLLNYSIYIYFSILLFLKDMSNYDNLALRISVLKWIGTKVIVQMIICLTLNIIILLPVYFNNYVDTYIFIILLKKILLITFISIYIYLIFFLYSKFKKVTSCIAILTFVLIMFLDINLFNIDLFIIISMFIVSGIILLIISDKLKFSDLKE